MKFTVETVTKMTGIPAASLRNWEKRYGFPTPERTEGGHRYYSAEDIEFLKKVVKWVEEGQCLSDLALRYQSKNLETKAALSEVMDDISYRTQLIYEALMNFDHNATLLHYQILNAKLSPEQLFDRVFELLLRRVDKEFKKQQITGAQQRFALAFMRLKLATFLAMEFPSSQKPRVLVTSISEDYNEASLMLIAAHLKFRGYPLLYFGTELPPQELKALVEQARPDILCLLYGSSQRILADVEYYRDLDIPIYVGGAGSQFKENQSSLSEVPKHIHFCQKNSGSEAALFIEMICQAKARVK